MPQKLQILRLANLPRPHRYTATMAARSRRQRLLARPPTLTLRKHYRDEGLAQHLSRPGCSISADRDCSISADRVPASQQTGTQHLSRPGLQPCLKAQPRVADQIESRCQSRSGNAIQASYGCDRTAWVATICGVLNPVRKPRLPKTLTRLFRCGRKLTPGIGVT